MGCIWGVEIEKEHADGDTSKRFCMISIGKGMNIGVVLYNTTRPQLDEPNACRMYCLSSDTFAPVGQYKFGYSTCVHRRDTFILLLDNYGYFGSLGWTRFLELVPLPRPDEALLSVAVRCFSCG